MQQHNEAGPLNTTTPHGTTTDRLQGRRLLVLVSCYNEEGRVGRVVRAVAAVLPGVDIAVIDDGSADDSRAEAAAAGAFVLRHACNLGAGAARETGYLYALKNHYDLVLHLDGDGQHPPEELGRILAPLLDDGADLVLGSRYLDPERNSETPAIRRLGHRVFSTVLRIVARVRITDPTSGLRGLNRTALSLFSHGYFPNDYPDSDVLLMAHLSGVRIREVAVTMIERGGGTSMHSGLKPLYYGVKMLFSIFIVMLNHRQWRRWRQARAT